MAASMVLGFAAIRRGDVTRHRGWMTRAYALALGAGTQPFTLGIGPAVFGPSVLTHDLSLGAVEEPEAVTTTDVVGSSAPKNALVQATSRSP